MGEVPFFHQLMTALSFRYQADIFSKNLKTKTIYFLQATSGLMNRQYLVLMNAGRNISKEALVTSFPKIISGRRSLPGGIHSRCVPLTVNPEILRALVHMRGPMCTAQIHILAVQPSFQVPG